MSVQDIEAQLESLRETLNALMVDKDNFSLDPDDYTDEFDEFLDVSNPEFFGHTPSAVLKDFDNIQYNEELSNCVDTLDAEEDSYYKKLVEEIEELEYEIEQLEEILEELKGEDDDE